MEALLLKFLAMFCFQERSNLSEKARKSWVNSETDFEISESYYSNFLLLHLHRSLMPTTTDVGVEGANIQDDGKRESQRKSRRRRELKPGLKEERIT